MNHLKIFILFLLFYLMDYVKEAFQKVREEIDSLKQEVSILRESMVDLCEIIKNLEEKKEFSQEIASTDQQTNQPTDRQINPADRQITSTDNALFTPLNAQNMLISTGNRGVPTDRQTNQQTNQQTRFTLKKEENALFEATEMLNSLDNIKKEIRLKFKRLTDQEVLVFSAIYQFEEERGFFY